MARRKALKRSGAKAPRVTAVMRTAYHEAGHAVLSAAINDTPHHVSIRIKGENLGRTVQKMFARPSSLAQVYLAGFAAEHLLTKRRPRQLTQEVALAILSLSYPALGNAFSSEHRDGHGVVQQLLRLGIRADDEELKRESERFYDIARESLTVVWSAVEAVAKSLLKSAELSREDLDEILGPFAVFTPVVQVQRSHGLLLAKRT